MKKTGKKVMSFTLDKKTFDSWKKYSEKKFINTSKLLEKLLQDYLRFHQKNEEKMQNEK